MPYRQETVTSSAVVDVQPSSDPRPYKLALLHVTGGTVRLVIDGTPTATFGRQIFGGERNQRIEGVGDVRNSKLIAESTTATVGIELKTEVE